MPVRRRVSKRRYSIEAELEAWDDYFGLDGGPRRRPAGDRRHRPGGRG